MGNYIQHNGSMAFHPGYYIEEIIDDMGLTQQEFAQCLDTTPKNISKLVNGEQRLSVDMAMKLSRMLGISMETWLNMQNKYDIAMAQMESEEELEEEKKILKLLGYSYFRDAFKLPDLPRRLDEQVAVVRQFLKISSLTMLADRDSAASFRSSRSAKGDKCIIRANAMVRIAMKRAMESDLPKYNRIRFKEAIKFALTQTTNHDGFYSIVSEAFRKAGVYFDIVHNISCSKTNGATKRMGDSVLLMVDGRCLNADGFWFTLLHEAGHILNGDFGVSLSGEEGEAEEAADAFTQNSLIDPMRYAEFCASDDMLPKSVCKFAKSIDRGPCIVIGRLQRDGLIRYDDTSYSHLRVKYVVEMAA